MVFLMLTLAMLFTSNLYWVGTVYATDAANCLKTNDLCD